MKTDNINIKSSKMVADFLEKNKEGEFYYLTRYGKKPHSSFDFSNKEKNIYLVGEPKKYAEIEEGCANREEIAQKLCDACNALGELTFSMESNRKRNKKRKK